MASEATGRVIHRVAPSSGRVPGGGSDEALGHLATAAAELLGAPAGVVGLADGHPPEHGHDDRGLGAGAARACRRVVAAGTELSVDDALASPHDETGGTDVLAWAGCPLVTADGDVVGALCVVDTEARRWSPRDRAVLRVLAAAATAEVSLHASLATAAAERAALRDLLMGAPAVIWRLRGPDHRVELVNRAALATIGGHEVELGRPMAESVPAIAEQGYLAILDHVFSTGEAVTANEAPVLMAPEEGGQVERRFLNYAATATRDDRNDVDGVLLVAVDVTEQVLARESESELRRRAEAARERAERLGELAASLSRGASEAEIIASIESLCRRLTGAVRAWLGLLDESGRNVVGAATSGGVSQEVVTEFAVVPMGTRLPVTDVVRSGRPLWSAAYEDLAARYPSMPDAVERAGFEALALLPLTSSGACTGALALTFEEQRDFDADERRFLSTVATLCGQAIERARLYDRQRTIALALQRQLLPRVLPDVEGMELASRYLPATHGAASGGDWFDAVLLSDGDLALTVGDVVGHGVEASATMGQLRSAWRALVHELPEPVELIAQLGRFAREVPGAAVATALTGRLGRDGRLVYARAGHMPPLVVAAGGPTRFLWGGAGVPLDCGVVRQTQDMVQLEPGDILVVFTDGVVERRGRTVDRGLADLARVAGDAGTPDPQGALDVIVRHFCADAEDDCALLAVRWGDARTP
jgi:GAF domain-containing protein